jgi:protein-L-isoaspartate O-methyltransferase
MDLDWETHARQLADMTVRPESRWYEVLATVPRHRFVPRWWVRRGGGRGVRIGRDDPERWMRAAYTDCTLVTQVGTHHADAAEPDDIVTGRTTSSSTMPSLVVAMYRHAMLGDTSRTLVTTGSGYGTALLCKRLASNLVTSMDIDPYLVNAAANRLSDIGLHPHLEVGDITDPPGTDRSLYDRIVATVSVPQIPAAWLSALRPGGRLVTTLSNTGLILTADKTEDGGARGRIEYDKASFMATRSEAGYSPTLDDVFARAVDQEGEEVHKSPFPVLDVVQAWDVWSMLSLKIPGIEHRTGTDDDGSRMTWMLHADGSWARARTRPGEHTATVHQSGTRRLYDELDDIRWWLQHGELPVHGAQVTISPDGTTTLSRGGWTATL